MHIFFTEDGDYENELYKLDNRGAIPKYCYFYGDDANDRGWFLWANPSGAPYDPKDERSYWTPKHKDDIPEYIKGLAALLEGN